MLVSGSVHVWSLTNYHHTNENIQLPLQLQSWEKIQPQENETNVTIPPLSFFVPNEGIGRWMFCCWESSSTRFTNDNCRKAWFTGVILLGLPPWKLTFPLKNYDWKMFLLKWSLFRWLCDIFGKFLVSPFKRYHYKGHVTICCSIP